MSELPKTFDPATIEARWRKRWEEIDPKTGRTLFRPHRPDATPYTIVNPPPNVTGALHIGHALDNTLQDVLIRYERLRGKDALWVVGMDHAGIATQMVVERQVAAQGKTKYDFATNELSQRDGFVSKIWDWKAESGGQITGQLRRLGCSMDWSREQFTMSPEFTKAVTKVFVDLYNKGLIYRDKRLVNWDPGLKTAISDLEVETREINGKFWHFRYPLADGVTLADGRDYIVVATTRPETMLADMAVAVNASDERYASVVGKHIILPITGRRIPIITDDHADPELGSGAVKITPGHDTNDFEVGRRAGIEARDMLNMFDGDARVVQVEMAGDISGMRQVVGGIPEDLIGLDRFDARKAVVVQMQALGLLVPHIDKEGIEHDAEPRTIQTPFGDRSGQVIEPWLTDQWYVDAATLAKPAIEAVRSGAVEIVPKSWEKTFFNWMENIQPWCVSRQLWWGHRIPAWHGWDSHIFVAETEAEAITLASAHDARPVIACQSLDEAMALGIEASGRNYLIFRDNDVLDTWFSSALWPFATLGWPDAEGPPRDGEGDHKVVEGQPRVGAPLDQQTHSPVPLHHPTDGPPPRAGEDLLARHYPNDVLISGFDILFFWDARMLMQGMEFMRDADGVGIPPWKKLYLHGLVRAPDGAKMSKSKGNVVDPLGLIDQYGADALRFFMAAMESQGRDIKMDDARLEGYRNFATKLWNATRFAQANGIGASATLAAPHATLPVNRWIIGEVAQTVSAMEAALAALRFDDAANAILHFTRDQFCDWYLEVAKPILQPLFNDEQLEQLYPDDLPADGTPTSVADDLAETRAVAGWVLDQILVMLHPFMPFITEELWHAQGARSYELIVAKWPDPRATMDIDARADINWLIDLTQSLRGAKAELGIAPGARLPLHVAEADASLRARIARMSASIQRVARIERIYFSAPPAGSAMQLVVGGTTYAVPLEGVIDTAAERARLTKAIETATKDRDSLAARLANPAFAERAKPEAVAKATEDHAVRAGEVERLSAALARLA